MVPSKVFFTEGVGRHSDELGSFEMALRDASVEAYNFVPVSSIIPPDASVVSVAEGKDELEDGQVVHAVLSRSSTRLGRVASSVGMARGDEGHGYLIERTAEGDGVETVGDEAVGLAVDLLEREPTQTLDVTAVAEGDGDVWTTAVALAVLVG